MKPELILQKTHVGKGLIVYLAAVACLLSSSFPPAPAGELRAREPALTKVEKERCVLLGLEEPILVSAKKELDSGFELVELANARSKARIVDCVFDEKEAAIVLRDWRLIAEKYPGFRRLVKKEEELFKRERILKNECLFPGSDLQSNSSASRPKAALFAYKSNAGAFIAADERFLAFGDGFYRRGLYLYALESVGFSRAFLNHVRGDEYARRSLKSLLKYASTSFRAAESFRVTARELSACDKLPLDRFIVGGPRWIVRLPAGATMKQVSGDVFEVTSRLTYLVPEHVQPVLLSGSESHRAVLRRYDFCGREVDQSKIFGCIERILKEQQGRIVMLGDRLVVMRLAKVPSNTEKFFKQIHRECPNVVDIERLNKLRPLFLSAVPEHRLFVLQWK